MKCINQRSFYLFLILCFASFAAMSQESKTNSSNNLKNNSTKTEMKTYLIEREIPGAGNLTAEQLKGVSQTSCTVLKEMGPKIEWIHSYVTGDKIFCIYKSENEELIKEHAKKGGFPVNKITQIANVISPATAN